MASVDSVNPLLDELFQNCPEDIQNQVQINQYKTGDLLSRQGDVPTSLSILLDGYIKGYSSASIDKHFLVEILKPGSIFFDIEILDELPCVCTLEAISECTVMTVPKDTYLEWLERDFAFAMYINRRLCDKLYKHITKSTRIMYTVKRRFLEWMISSLKASPVYPYRVSLSKSLVAEELGTTERSISRIIKDLADKKAILFENNTIYIKSFDIINQELTDLVLEK